MKLEFQELAGPFETSDGLHCRVKFGVFAVNDRLDSADALAIKVLIPAPSSATIPEIVTAASRRVPDLLRQMASALEGSDVQPFHRAIEPFGDPAS